MAMIHRKGLWLLALIPLFSHLLGSLAEGCPACWSGYGPGDERFNKPLYDLRILYETQGKAALPAIREALRNPDPLVQQRAAGYLADLKDADSAPLLEDMLSEVLKRVTFGSFGIRSFEFQTRLAVAHALVKIGPTRMADRIWERYDRLDLQKKAEVPYLLNALGDPKLTERLLEILDRCEDHQLMVGALEVLAIGGNAQAVPVLRSKITEWEGQGMKVSEASTSTVPLDYLVLRLKAEQAISQIEERHKGS